ncbi:MAG: hypothetical protein RMJ44_07350 [Cytophagales bacterium]|nr:hypothetical protein [Bernardetiaceae bacterium]MDW8210890.1 hypothetical protein [Cytophagales bacterium]
MIEQTPYWTIQYETDYNIIVVHWHAPASTMAEEEYKTCVLRFVDLLRQLKIEKFLVDASAGHLIMLPHIQEWHDKVIAPQYEEMGIKKIAFVYPNNITEAISLEQTYDEKRARQLHAKFFDDFQNAYRWLIS